MLTDTEYKFAVERAQVLTELDPEINTPAADELLRLVKRIQEYERYYFPHLFNNKTIITGNAE